MSDFVRASILKGFCDMVLGFGGDPDAFLEQVGIDKDVAGNSEKFIAYSDFIALLELVEQELNVSRVGLRLGLTQNYRVLGPVAFLALASEDIREALYSVKSYFPQFSSALSFDFQIREQVEIVVEFSDAKYGESAHAAEHAIATAAKVLSSISDGHCLPAYATFRHGRPDNGVDYEALLNCEVRFSQRHDAVVIDAECLDVPIVTADRELKYLVSSYLAIYGGRQALSQPKQRAFITKVFQLVAELLPQGRATRSIVADALQIHERSLHRRLADFNQTFESIVDAVRRDKVQELMAQEELSMAEIARLLGYSDQSSFNRAFKRWFGITPVQYASRFSK